MSADFEAVRRIRREHGDLPLSNFKALVREQFNMLLVDTDAALAAIPAMLPADAKTRQEGLQLIGQVLEARGPLPAEGKERMQRITRLFEEDPSTSKNPFRNNRKELQARAS